MSINLSYTTVFNHSLIIRFHIDGDRSNPSSNSIGCNIHVNLHVHDIVTFFHVLLYRGDAFASGKIDQHIQLMTGYDAETRNGHFIEQDLVGSDLQLYMVRISTETSNPINFTHDKIKSSSAIVCG